MFGMMLGQHYSRVVISLEDDDDDLYTDPQQGVGQLSTQAGQGDSSKLRTAGTGVSSSQAVAESGLRRREARQELRTDDVSSLSYWVDD